MIWKTQPRSKVGCLQAISTGNGPLVLLIHGVGLRAEAWGAQTKALAQSYHVVAVDIPGHGDSPALHSAPELEDFVEAIVASLDGPAVVVGHSFGAMIALAMAIRHPKRVKAVAALNAIYDRDPDAQAAVIARADSLDGKTVSDPTATLDRWFASSASEQRNACEHWLRTVNPAGYRDAYRVFAAHNGPAATDLQTIRCPVLFMTGGQEPNSTPAMSHEMASHVPDGRAEIIEKAAHMMPMTHATTVNALLSDFIGGSS